MSAFVPFIVVVATLGLGVLLLTRRMRAVPVRIVQRITTPAARRPEPLNVR